MSSTLDTMRCRARVAVVLAVVAASTLTTGSALAATPPPAPTGQISTIVGGVGSGTAVSVAMQPRWVATQGSRVYISDETSYLVRVMDAVTGEQHVVAGNGTAGSSGDGGPATSAQLYAGGLAVDAAGNVFVADTIYHRIRRVDAKTGRISTIAGTGVGAFAGDGGPATAAKLASPSDLAFDGQGNLFFADGGNQRIRRIDRVGTMTTVAGNGQRGNAGDGGPALAAQVDAPQSLAVNALGEVFVPATGRIRKIGLDGRITTVVGNGQQTSTGDGGPALQAGIEGPAAVEFDSHGNMFISEYARVRKVDVGGTISTFAGNRQTAFAGDGGQAIQAAVSPVGLAVDSSDSLYIASPQHGRVRRVAPGGIITTVAGNGTEGFSGAGGPAVTAQIGGPFGSLSTLTTDAAGNLFVALYAAVVRIDGEGTLTVVAGDPYAGPGYSGDGGPATAARLSVAASLAADGLGNLYIADAENHRVRRVDPFGTITTVAGTGAPGFSGDGGPATQARLNRPYGVATDAAGNLFIADTENQRVRWVDLTGTITTIVGSGVRGLAGDGGPATQAQLDYPGALAIDPTGALHVLEPESGRLRRISSWGTITSVGTAGIPAKGFAFDAAGQLYVTEMAVSMTDFNDIRARVHRISGGQSTVVAGIGPEGYSGDGGPATAARISRLRGIAFDPDGNLDIADFGNGKIRQVAGVGPRRDASLLSWGLNASGQLGHASGGPSIPVGVGGAEISATATVAVRAGTAHSLALSADGTVWSWGFNVLGQLGNGSTVDASQPVKVNGLTDAKAIGSGYLHSLAVRQDGTVVSWGWNEHAQLGTGSTTNSKAPVVVSGLTDVVAVAGGASHSLALKADGTVWAWGFNHLGQLGVGAAVESRVPVMVPQLTGVVSIAAGAFSSVALRSDGTVWTWGWNIFGQLGTGLTLDRRTPTQVAGLTGVTAVASGAFHVLALREDGTVSGFGLNHLGQLGRGPIVVPAPVRIAGLAGIHSVAAGAYHSLAATAGGTALAWGFNAYGQLGDGTTTDRPTPVAVAALDDVVALAAGVGHTLAATGATPT